MATTTTTTTTGVVTRSMARKMAAESDVDKLEERFLRALRTVARYSAVGDVRGDTNYMKLVWMTCKTPGEKRQAVEAFENSCAGCGWPLE